MSQDTSDIHRAVMDGNLNIVKMLLAENPKLAILRDVDSRTPIHWACSFQHYEILEALLDRSGVPSHRQIRQVGSSDISKFDNRLISLEFG